LDWRRPGAAVFGEPDQQRVAPRVEQRLRGLGWDRRELLVTGVVGGGVEPVQGTQRLGGPRLIGIRFAGGDQLSADMCAAQGVPGAGVGVVDAQRVVHHGSAERGQHVELGHRSPAAGGVQVVRGQRVGAGHVQPPPDPVDGAGGLVDVDHVREHDQRLDQLLDVDQHLGDRNELRADPAGRRVGPGQVGDQRLGAGDRDVLEHQQVHRQRAQVRAVHRRRTDPSRRGRGRGRPAAAAPAVEPVLDHDGSDGRDVVDLAAHHAERRSAGQVAAAATARLRNMVDDLVGVAGLEQRRPARAGLLTRAPGAMSTRGSRR
jgi:hypothetical protein